NARSQLSETPMTRAIPAREIRSSRSNTIFLKLCKTYVKTQRRNYQCLAVFYLYHIFKKMV
ncbi:hypothetical protein, partial [Microcoleus sp. N9_A2]|uniref:hypothetical protein n=1 Tax=Microcoleus sp. N9_A2 TaxID=3055381 RepID=UPI002FD1DCA9